MGRRAGVTAEQTRRQLLDAATRVFAERGYDGARVSDIAREAGVSTGAIYNHFASKAELLAAAITDHGPHVVHRVLTAGGGLSVLDAFRQEAAALPHRPAWRAGLLVEVAAAARRDRTVAGPVVAAIAENESRLADMIRIAQGDRGADGALDASALARLAVTVSLGSLVGTALGLPPVDDEQWSAVVNRILDTVGGEPGAGGAGEARRPVPVTGVADEHDDRRNHEP